MSLRLRLNLVYTILLGGSILLFGVLVYSLVSYVQLQQVDNTLLSAKDQIISNLGINTAGQFGLRSLTGFSSTNNLYYQVWGNDRILQISYPPNFQTSLDPAGLRAGVQVTEYATFNGSHLRVLSVPLVTER